MNYQPRTYRTDMQADRLKYFSVVMEETDLRVGVGYGEWNDSIPTRIGELTLELRQTLKSWIVIQPAFLHSHKPLSISEKAPPLVQLMVESTKKANVGPMAAVAGTFAKLIGERICEEFQLSNLIIENGGDIWLKSSEPVIVRIDAGNSSLTGLIGIEIQANQTPCGICTSSGTTGHSFSYGKADSVSVVSGCASLADAWATALCNQIQTSEDLIKVVPLQTLSAEIQGVVSILKESVAASGNITLKKLRV